MGRLSNQSRGGRGALGEREICDVRREMLEGWGENKSLYLVIRTGVGGGD